MVKKGKLIISSKIIKKAKISTTFFLQVLLQESLQGHGIGLNMNMFMMRMNL